MILVQLNQISAVGNNCYLQWLMQDTCSYNPTLPYYIFISPRIKGRGGEVCILVHSDLPTTTIIHPYFFYSDCLLESPTFINSVYSFLLLFIPKQDYTTFYKGLLRLYN